VQAIKRLAKDDDGSHNGRITIGGIEEKGRSRIVKVLQGSSSAIPAESLFFFRRFLSHAPHGRLAAKK